MVVGGGVLLILALLFHSQHHWFTPIRCSRMSLHRFPPLGSPEANSPPHPVCLPLPPTHANTGSNSTGWGAWG